MQKEKHLPFGTKAVSYIVKFDTYLGLRFPVHIPSQKDTVGREGRVSWMHPDSMSSPRGASIKFLPYSSVDSLKNNVQPHFSPCPYKLSSKLNFPSGL